MVLVFEASDLAGKTTLAEHYAKSLRIPIVKIRWDLVHERAETVAFAKATIGLLAATGANVILDRSFVSMWAYSQDNEYVEPLVEHLRLVPDLHLVVLTMGRDELHRRYTRAPDAFFSEESLQTVDARFQTFEARFGKWIDILHLDTASFSPDECVARIDRHLGLRSAPFDPDAATAARRVNVPIGEIPVGITFPA